MTKRVTAVIVDRANYGRLLPVLEGLRDDPRFELSLILGGSFVLPRFGWPWRMLEADQLHHVDQIKVYHEVDGNCAASRAQSIGLGICHYAAALEQLDSEYVVIIGDRYEALAAAQAALYSGRTLVHFQGGEVSGTLDEPTRHATTKLAHYHVPATTAAQRVIVDRLGEHFGSVLTVGCPASDLAGRVRDTERPSGLPYILVMYHPEGVLPGRQMERVLSAVYPFTQAKTRKKLGLKVWWPNIDPSSDQITRKVFHHQRRYHFDVLRNVHPLGFLRLLRHASVCVGNSSSFIRDAAYFGTPVVNVGNRQIGREKTINVVQVGHEDEDEISEAIDRQLWHGRYLPDMLYGDGRVTERFLDALAGARHYQKHLLRDGLHGQVSVDPAAA